MKLFYTGLLLLNCTCFLYGQDPAFEQFTVNEGLPATECYKTIQDHKGYVWVFTEYGIVKHNGERFVPVCTNIATKEQNAYAVFKTPEGKIYFANSCSRIYEIRNDSAFSIKAIDKYTRHFNGANDVIYQLIVDKNKDIYFSSFTGHFCYRAATDVVEELETAYLKAKNCILYRQINGYFFAIKPVIGTLPNTLISICDGKQVIQFKYLEDFTFRKKVLKAKGSYYLISANFLYKTGIDGPEKSREIPGILNFAIDEQNKIWVLTYNGVKIFDLDLKPLGTCLEGQSASDICFDNQNGVWLTTLGQGVFYCRNKYELLHPFNRAIRDEMTFIQPVNNKVFFSYVNGQCYQLDKGGPLLVHDFDRAFVCNRIVPYQNGYLFSSKQGIYFKNKRGQVKDVLWLKGSKTYSKYIDVIGENEFLSFGHSFIRHYKNQAPYASYPFNVTTNCVLPLQKQKYLIGTANGILQYDHPTKKVTSYHTFFDNKYVIKLVHDPRGNLWISTKGEGIYIMNHKTITHQKTPFFVIKDIDFYNNELLFVSTNSGVFMNSYKGTEITGEWVNVFDFEANQTAIVGNELWVASRNGLRTIKIPLIDRAQQYPIFISSVYAGSKKVLTRSSVLRHNENDLCFNFDFLSYQNRVKQFYFVLKGPTALSGTITGSKLQIQNLRPGSYTLHVYPYHGPGFNKAFFISTRFFIDRAFWQTWWFRLLMLLLALCTPGIIVAFYHRNKRNRERKKTEINKLLAEYRLTALKAQMNPHFISNSLSAIQLLMDSGQVNEANRYVSQFSLLIRYVLEYSDKNAIKLSEELRIAELNIEMEQLRFSSTFHFQKNIAADIEVKEIYVPPLIMQPFIENAIWHGLIPLKSGKIPQITLGVEKSNDLLIISVTDNGVGRKKKPVVVQQSESLVRKSKGTVLSQKRIQNLNSLYNISASICFTDLYDENSNPAGTRVEIFLPLTMLNQLQESI